MKEKESFYYYIKDKIDEKNHDFVVKLPCAIEKAIKKSTDKMLSLENLLSEIFYSSVEISIEEYRRLEIREKCDCYYQHYFSGIEDTIDEINGKVVYIGKSCLDGRDR